MTPTEHLAAIAAKCRDNLAREYVESFPSQPLSRASLLSTLAAIESVPITNRGSSPHYTQREKRLIAALLAAWPEKLL